MVLALVLSGVSLTSHPASAAEKTGSQGQKLTVEPADNLNPDGDTVKIKGSGFDLGKGIYVVFCVNKGEGQQPTPCLGGVDMSGSSGASAWISSNPPSYGEGLAKPFEDVGGKGSFEVSLSVKAQDEFTNCLDSSQAPQGCVVGTRADHTRTADRSADVLVPVTFAGGGAVTNNQATTQGEQGSSSGSTSGSASGDKAGATAGSSTGSSTSTGTTSGSGSATSGSTGSTSSTGSAGSTSSGSTTGSTGSGTSTGTSAGGTTSTTGTTTGAVTHGQIVTDSASNVGGTNGTAAHNATNNLAHTGATIGGYVLGAGVLVGAGLIAYRLSVSRKAAHQPADRNGREQ